MDNQKDFYIKEKLQKDNLMSKKVDDVFNNFLKGEMNMNEEEEKRAEEKFNKNNKKRGNQKFKRILTTAASLLIVFGAANVYASTQGYGNIFFMIKYLVTGDSSVISNKDEILSDRDITISYELIKLTDNIEIQIKNLQIKDNVAKLFVVVDEDELESNTSVVPLKYEVYNASNEKLCSQNSTKTIEANLSTYTEELVLDNFKTEDEVLNLKIYKANNSLITSLRIDLNERTIEVEGEEEALEKISEIDLKEFLGEVSGLYGDDGKILDDDSKVLFAIALLSANDKLEENKINNETYYSVEMIEKALENFGEIDLEKFNGTNYELVKKDGVEYFKLVYGRDGMVFAECIDVSNISYCAGTYTATYTYCRLGEESIFDIDINDYDILQNTVTFTLNSNSEYSKFKLQTIGTPETIKSKDEKEVGSIEDTTTTTTTTDTNTNTNQSSQSNNTTTTTTDTTVSNTKVDNYASTMSWTEYWGPGIKLSYPTIFSVWENSSFIDGILEGQLAVAIGGDAVGIDPDTKEIITSDLTIEVYEPLYTTEPVSVYQFDENGQEYPHTTTNSGLVWYETDSYENLGTDAFAHIYTYTHYEELADGVNGLVYKIRFITQNPDNYKVTNIMNWLIGTTKITSY